MMSNKYGNGKYLTAELLLICNVFRLDGECDIIKIKGTSVLGVTCKFGEKMETKL